MRGKVRATKRREINDMRTEGRLKLMIRYDEIWLLGGQMTNTETSLIPSHSESIISPAILKVLFHQTICLEKRFINRVSHKTKVRAFRRTICEWQFDLASHDIFGFFPLTFYGFIDLEFSARI